MNKIILVFIGGGIGSVARYGIGSFFSRLMNGVFPWGTFAINIAASFVLGLLAGFFILRQGEYETQRLLIGVGFCGGFSTFSTFTLELFQMIKDGNTAMAFIYVIASVIAALLAFWSAQMILRVA
jgi:fluoride exporter